MQANRQNGANRVLIAIGLLIALGLPFIHLAYLGRLFAGLGHLWSEQAAWLVFLAIILLYVLGVERRPLSSIGFRAPALPGLLLGVAAAVAIIGGDIAISRVEAALHLHVKPEIASLFQTAFWFRVVLVTRAAVAEEVVFRGYGFERITELTGSKYLAAAATFALFALAHYSGGGLALFLVAAWGGLILTLLYLWQRNLWITITAHWLTDAVGFLLVPLMSAHH
ncbi:MAG TPA: CPBP family intramembrane glutamic endopeptidase [Rhizomicrobium sp.]|nr:CPBP family intramembrane glutamic endopeptidase [Rhizomicrobium sp.]